MYSLKSQGSSLTLLTSWSPFLFSLKNCEEYAVKSFLLQDSFFPLGHYLSNSPTVPIVQLGIGIYPQGSVTGKTIRRELGLQPVGHVSSRPGAQTKERKTDSKTTRDIECPDLPGVMLLILNNSNNEIVWWLDGALKSLFPGLSILKTAPTHLILLVCYITNDSSATYLCCIQ